MKPYLAKRERRDVVYQGEAAGEERSCLKDHFHCRSCKESRVNTSHLSSAAEKTDTPVDVGAFMNWLLGWITPATERMMLLLFLYDCQISPRGDRQRIYPANDLCLQPRYDSPLIRHMSHVEGKKQHCHGDLLCVQWWKVNIRDHMRHSALEWSFESELNLLQKLKLLLSVFTSIQYMEQFKLTIKLL